MRLHEYPYNRIRLECEKCERKGNYRKRTLLERFGGNIQLPDMLAEISHDCPLQGPMQSVGMNPCGIIYPDLRILFFGR